MTVYALHHPDGRWLFHLTKPDTEDFRYARDLKVLADGQPMEELRAGWWAAGSEPDILSITGLRGQKTVGYRLSDPDTESVKYPATLTVAEFDERRECDDNMWELYTAVREDQDPVEHVYDGPIVVLEGREPPTPDEPQWVAALPHALTERPEYKHLFPGHIPGLRAHVYKLIEAMPRVKYCFDNYQNYNGLHVVVRVPFDQPRTEFRRDTSRRTGKPLKTGRNVPVTVEHRIQLPVPASCYADTYEQALAAWQEQVAFWVRQVEEASVAACSACNGTGHVPQGAKEYSR